MAKIKREQYIESLKLFREVVRQQLPATEYVRSGGVITGITTAFYTQDDILELIAQEIDKQ